MTAKWANTLHELSLKSIYIFFSFNDPLFAELSSAQIIIIVIIIKLLEEKKKKKTISG